MNAPHLTLIDCTALESAQSGEWLAGEFGDHWLPFHDLYDALEMFSEHHTSEPDVLYLHPDTSFWLNLIYSNYDADSTPEEAPFWVELKQMALGDLKVRKSALVPKGWWFICRSIDIDTDLAPWR
jgi:hypothetical protein